MVPSESVSFEETLTVTGVSSLVEVVLLLATGGQLGAASTTNESGGLETHEVRLSKAVIE